MELARAYKFRIYPDTKRQEEVDERLILAQQLYNKILERSIAAYQNRNTKASMAQFNRFVKEIINEDKRFLKLYSQTRCEIEYRTLKAYQNFFRRIKEGNKKAGFPRFKSKDRYKSITYPQDNGSFSIRKDRLRVSRIGTMRIEMHRKIEGTIKTLAIKREGRKYYAIFTAIKEAEIPKIKDINPVGIDVGLKTFAVLSDGTKIAKPNFRKNAEKHVTRWQRIFARRKKGSKRRQLAKDRLNKEYETANNQTNDYLHKITNKLVNSGYTSFAVEKLQIQNMVKDHRLAKSINYASWNKFFQLLSYKAESAGMKVIEVDPRNTSKTCSNCGNTQSMPLSKRIYFCKSCGLVEDRDINASINILNRALHSKSANFDSKAVKATLGQRESHAWGDSASTMQKAWRAESLNQEHTLQHVGEAHGL